MYFFELGIPGGEEVDWGEGIALFFQEALGGSAIGICFGVALVFILYLLNRRLNHEENSVQVSATIAMAYLAYFVADAVAGTSGVLAVVFLGITTKLIGNSMINDQELMSNFWQMFNYILNTILFSLGGVVWGYTISNSGFEKFTASDWGYLVVRP
jgi:NhaP-type Na+/H+ or K+/H+ antiporter